MHADLEKMRSLLEEPVRDSIIKQAAVLFLQGITLQDFETECRFKPYLLGLGVFENKGDKEVMEQLKAQMEADTAGVRLPYLEPIAAELWFRGISKEQFLATVKKIDPAEDESYNVHTYAA